MPVDLEAIVDPRFILLGWAAGLGLVTGWVALTRIVGPGFTWLGGGVATALGLAGFGVEGGGWPAVSLTLATLALVLARKPTYPGVLLIVASLGHLVGAAGLGGWLLAVTAAIALGGVSGEMALGHWYLVDPRLPRWALRTLAVVGIIGLAADGISLATLGDFDRSGPVIAFLTLLLTSVALMVAVLAALRHRAYSGVMAATGLSYLAVLTSVGAVFLGRALIAGVGPFTN